MTDLEVLHPGLSATRGAFRDETLPLSADLGRIPERLWIPTPTPGYDRLTDWALNETSTDESMQKVYIGLKSIAGKLLDSVPPSVLQVNRYHTFSNGPWHDDFPYMLPVFVLGLTDVEDPSFEYARQVVRNGNGRLIPGHDIGKTVLKPGDLLKTEAQDFVHRGVNPTAGFRYSAAIPSWGAPLIEWGS